MSKILVTGHMGWIGTEFTKLLDLHNIRWSGMDRQNGYWLGPTMHQFEEQLEDCDIVVHLAATPRIPRSWELSDDYRTNNVVLTDKIAKLCTIHQKYLVFASSSSIYGNGEGPLNPYSWTKLASEESIKMYGRAAGLKYSIARIFTNYGGSTATDLVISKWLSNYHRSIPLVLRGDGSQRRDFINVSDTTEALLQLCLQRPDNKTLDIGTGVNTMLSELAYMFKCPVTFEPELPGYAETTCADADTTYSEIGWRFKVKLNDWLTTEIARLNSSIML